MVVPAGFCSERTCHRVYREVHQERHMTTTPPGHMRYFTANGRPSTPAPTMAVVL